MANNDIIVSEMTSATQINTGDLMIMTQPDAQAETGYSTKKGTVLQVANKMLKDTEYTTDLPSFTDKNVLGGLEELKGNIASLLPVDEASGAIANFETALALPFVSVLANVVATGGNGTPDNPIPINGYTEANITRCGVNLWDEEWEVGGINYNTGETVAYLDRIRSKNYVPIVGGTSYYACSPLDASTDYVNIAYYDASKTFISGTSTRSKTWTAPANACYFKFGFPTSYGTTYNNDISINYPSTDTSYHAYNGQTYTIAFGQTVYGGVLDVTRGKLHVTYGRIDLGSMTYNYGAWGSNNVFTPTNATRPDIKNAGNAICEVYEKISDTSIYQGTDKAFCVNNNNLRFADSSYTSANAFKTAMSGHYLVYELATPFDIDLTPEVISAIVGENNVFADCGGVDVKFKDSIQHYIDKKIAQTQALIL